MKDDHDKLDQCLKGIDPGLSQFRDEFKKIAITCEDTLRFLRPQEVSNMNLHLVFKRLLVDRIVNLQTPETKQKMKRHSNKMSTQRKILIIDTDGGIDDAQAIFMMLDSTEYDVIASFRSAVDAYSECHLLFINHPDKMSTQRKMLIIDTDGGIDDAHAIFMMLDSTVYDVIALTCVRGNSGVEQVVCNVLKILGAADKLNIPVYSGCAFSIRGQNTTPKSYHGEDGLGDCPSVEEPDVSVLQSETATDAIIRLTKELPGEITLMCIGPLTNLATALKMDPDFGSRLRDCFIMGGNYYGKGNITVSAEFNFHSDPEAPSIVLEQLGCPTTLVGLEVCLKNGLTWDQYRELRRFPGKRNQFLEAIERNPVAFSIEEGWNFSPPDAVLAACMSSPPEVVMETKHVYATVELDGKFTYGQMVVDWNNVLKNNPNLTIVTKIDKNAFYTVLLNTAKSDM